MAQEKILLIDDEENILMLYQQELLEDGYQVHASSWVTVMVTVTKLVSFKVIGLRQVLKANDLTD